MSVLGALIRGADHQKKGKKGFNIKVQNEVEEEEREWDFVATTKLANDLASGEDEIQLPDRLH